MVKLDIISDPICPWCYIGKTNLDRALEQIPNHPFTIEWHPFQLNPTMKLEGMDRRAYLENKFGGKEAAVKAYTPVLKAAEVAGLKIDFAGMKRTPNTIDAHRLIHWAGIEQRQPFVVQRLFEAYFRDARDIGDRDVLLDIADGCEMDAGVIGKLLNSDADIEDTQKRDAHSREMGVSSVPTFIVANQHAVPGAQPTEMWLKVMGEIIQKIEATE
ncbi:MAG: putative DsbA family dithiol-disulfide isomerase [Alteromonas macleodii]|jgi:predicted DsbA family dithiol-disulfide isomerase